MSRNSGRRLSGSGSSGRRRGPGGRLLTTWDGSLRRICFRRRGCGSRCTPVVIRRLLLRCVGARSGCACSTRMPWGVTTGCGAREPGRWRRCGRRCRCSGERRTPVQGTRLPNGVRWKPRRGCVANLIAPKIKAARGPYPGRDRGGAARAGRRPDRDRGYASPRARHHPALAGQPRTSGSVAEDKSEAASS